MEATKRNILFKEFPFIKKDEYSNICISRIDENLLNQAFIDTNHFGAMGSSSDDYSVELITEDYTIYTDIGIGYDEQETCGGSVYREGEKVIEAIIRLNIQKSLKYIVVYYKGYCDWEGSSKRKWNIVTVYKLPKSKTIEEIVKDYYKRQVEEVKKMIDF